MRIQDKYIAYNELKKMLKTAHGKHSGESSPLLRHTQEDVFFDKLHTEFSKVCNDPS